MFMRPGAALEGPLFHGRASVRSETAAAISPHTQAHEPTDDHGERMQHRGRAALKRRVQLPKRNGLQPPWMVLPEPGGRDWKTIAEPLDYNARACATEMLS
jgi:hypothetical protein